MSSFLEASSAPHGSNIDFAEGGDTHNVLGGGASLLFSCLRSF